MNKDLNKGISSIQYNSLNLPRMLDIKSPVAEGRNEYTYTASGVKLKVVQKWNPNYSKTPAIGSAITPSSLTITKTTDYVGNKIYESGTLKRILVDGGYIENGVYYFYLTDHLGNNRVVANQSGTVAQINHYYPFGMHFAPGMNAGTQPYMYNGKELDMMHGLNLYDYSARYYESAIGRFTSVDPLAEKYYSISPYAYVGNNPIIRTDPTGMDWYQDSDGTYQYNEYLTEKTKDLFIAVSAFFGKEISYVGETYQTTDEVGNVTADYRQDGSIMYANDEDAFSRVVNNSQKTGKEELVALLDKGALVLPSWGNEKRQSKYKEYKYDFKGGTMFDPVTKKTFGVIATAHTHPNSGDMTGDVGFAEIKTPLKPMYAFYTGGEQSGFVDYILHSGTGNNYTYRSSKQYLDLTVSNVISGQVSLRKFSKDLVKKHTLIGKFNAYP